MFYSRRAFITKTLTTLAAVPALGSLLAACNPIGKVINSDLTRLADCTSGTTTYFANPVHMHTTVSLSILELEASEPGPYLLLDGDHKHYVTLTPNDFISLKIGEAVQKMDEDGHGHLIILSC